MFLPAFGSVVIREDCEYLCFTIYIAISDKSSRENSYFTNSYKILMGFTKVNSWLWGLEGGHQPENC